jgi:hypothetical protein
VTGKYSSKNEPLSVKCTECGFEWDSTANRLLAGHGCRKCAGVRKRHKRGYYKKTHQQFVEELYSVNPNVIPRSEYVSAHDKIDCECAVCGYLWSAKAANLLTGIGCPSCAQKACSEKQMKSHNVFISEMKELHKDIDVLGRYNGNICNVRLRCDRCGHEWDAMPINLLRRDGKATGCPRCRSSHGEARIAKWLNDHDILHEQYKKYDGLLGVKGRPLSYDFYLPEQNILIEYQGQFHDHTAGIQTDEDYDTQREHDLRKRDYAALHAINLLEIWYYENIEEKLGKEFDNIKEPVTTTAS